MPLSIAGQETAQSRTQGLRVVASPGDNENLERLFWLDFSYYRGMALLESTMLPLGTQRPEFSLLDTVSASPFSSSALAGAPSLIMVICNHCPYVVRLKELLATLGAELVEKGVQVVALSANDANKYPADAPDRMKDDAARFGYPFPYLYDETQAVARALQAECTPEFYLFDAQGQLTYRGRLDESTPGNGKTPDGADLRGAVDALLAGKPPVTPQLPSIGCSIKWR